MIHDIAIYVAVFAAGMLIGYLLKVVMDNSKITIRYLFIYVIILVFIPIFINRIMLISSPFKVYNGDWLSFWGAYLGAIVSFIILYVTINNNKAENEKSRAAQSNLTKCQLDYSKLDNLNACFSNYICSLSQLELGIIAYQSKYEPIASRNRVSSILKQANDAYERLNLSLVLYNSERAQSLKMNIKHFQEEYNKTLPDVCYIINSFLPGNSIDELSKDIEQNPSHNMIIINIIKNRGYNIKNNQADIMYDLINGLDFEKINEEFETFVLNEKQIIDNKISDINKS